MKLLSVGCSAHDANMTYFDGHKIHYYKKERIKGVKHDSWQSSWEWRQEFENFFKTKIEEVNAIALDITFFYMFDEDANLTLFRNKNIYYKGHITNKFASYLQDSTIEKLISLFKGDINYFKCPQDLLNIYHHSNDNIWIVSHYYLHSLSAWMMTDKNIDVSICLDGQGDYYNSGKIFRNDKMVRSFHYWESIGHTYIHLANMLEIRSDSNSSELGFVDDKSALPLSGKLMSFQSYGKIDYNFAQTLEKYGMDEVSKIFDIQNWIDYKQDKLVAEKTLIDFAATVHYRCGQLLVSFFEECADPAEIIVYTGGVAQNVCWNTLLRQKFPNLIIPPHCGDEGLSLGGVEFLRRMFNLPKFRIDNFPYIQSDVSPETTPSEKTIDTVAKLLSNGYTVGWYQGNGECGPRALGNRSILFDPRILNGKSIVNNVKNRENYRPFGASVLKEHQDEYFDIGWNDDYMLYTSKVKQNLPAITHVDGTCRIQTVTYKNPSFRRLLERFNEITGCPVLLNTSLNISGKGLAGYPEEAMELLYVTSLDYMVIGDKIYGKK